MKEIRKIFGHFDDLQGMILSGGEPFFRDDILEVMDYFIAQRGVKGFGIPSNCVDTRKIVSRTDYLISKYPDTSFVICCGLDPSEKIHNKFRGSGIYTKVVKTIKKLTQLAVKNKNLLILVNSVVTKEAIPHLDKCVSFVYSLRPNLHNLDIVRTYSEKDKRKFANFTKSDYAKILKNRIKIDNLYRRGDLLFPLYKIRTRILTKTQRSCLENQGKWPIKCLAGVTSLVVQSNGDLHLCENRPPLGNLRNYNYDYREILEKKMTPDMLQEIADHMCDCNHIVYLRESLESNFIKAVLDSLLRDSKWRKRDLRR